MKIVYEGLAPNLIAQRYIEGKLTQVSLMDANTNEFWAELTKVMDEINAEYAGKYKDSHIEFGHFVTGMRAIVSNTTIYVNPLFASYVIAAASSGASRP